MGIIEKFYGTTKNNEKVTMYTIKNNSNMEVDIINYGGIVTSIRVPDKNGNIDDVVLGYDTLEAYESGDKYFGALIGRCSNRIKNACFKLNGKEYNLAKNNGKNHLHGGNTGFDKVIWNAEIVEKNKLKLSYLSKDGEENYPGNLKVNVYYSLSDDNELKIEYYATTDKATLVNLTNHSYFNLGGKASDNILNEKILINADKFTVTDDESIPTGELRNVSNTPMDFKTLKVIGDNIDSDYEQIIFGQGYDHNWILNSKGDINVLAAKVIDEISGRVMEVYTTNEGVQFYTGNFLEGTVGGKNGKTYGKRSGLCLETQYIPDSINHINFSSCILNKNEEYKHITIYKFLTK